MTINGPDLDEAVFRKINYDEVAKKSWREHLGTERMDQPRGIIRQAVAIEFEDFEPFESDWGYVTAHAKKIDPQTLQNHIDGLTESYKRGGHELTEEENEQLSRDMDAFIAADYN